MASIKNNEQELSPDYLKYIKTRLSLCGPYGHPLVCQNYKPTNYNPATDRTNNLIAEKDERDITNKI